MSYAVLSQQGDDLSRLGWVGTNPQAPVFENQLQGPVLKLTRHRARWKPSVAAECAVVLVIQVIFVGFGVFTRNYTPVVFGGVVGALLGLGLTHIYRRELTRCFQFEVRDDKVIVGEKNFPLAESLLVVNGFEEPEKGTHFEVSILVGSELHLIGTWPNAAAMVPDLMRWARRHGLKAAHRRLAKRPPKKSEDNLVAGLAAGVAVEALASLLN